MKTFVPHLFIGIGEGANFYTLRETYEHVRYIPGAGPMGNAVVNGVYQGSRQVEIWSFHHCNLAQNADEALAKAKQHAERLGLELHANREKMEEQLREIRRATEEELAARAEAARVQQEIYAQMRKEAEQERRDKIAAGEVSFGKYRGTKIEDLPYGYAEWLLKTKNEFDPESLMRVLAEEVEKNYPQLILPKPDPTVMIGDVGERREFNVVVLRKFVISRPSFSGYGMDHIAIVTMVDEATKACIVSKSAAFAPEEGVRLKFKATVKCHDSYKGQAQTVVQRVKC